MTVPSQAGNLSDFLKSGGVSSVPAEQAANQIGNAFRQQLSRGPVQVDYTPDAMRLITPQARKYLFTNLDWEDNPAYRNSKRSRKRPEQERQLVDPRRHPLQGSQPVTVTQAINEQQVFPGPYTEVLSQRRNGFAVYTIGLRLGTQKGTHARFNESTKAIEGVPIEWDINQNQFLKGSVKETPDATRISLSLQNLQAMELPVYSGGQWLMQPIVGWQTGAAYAPGPTAASFYAEGTWTPSFDAISGTSPTLTYTQQLGRYIRVGNLVTLWGRVVVGTVTSPGSGNLRIVGIPINATDVANGYFSGVVSLTSAWANNAPEHLVMQATGVGIAVRYRASTTADGPVSLANLADSCAMSFTITYPTTAL